MKTVIFITTRYVKDEELLLKLISFFFFFIKNFKKLKTIH